MLKKVIDGAFSPVIEELKALKKGKKGKWANLCAYYVDTKKMGSIFNDYGKRTYTPEVVVYVY